MSMNLSDEKWRSLEHEIHLTFQSYENAQKQEGHSRRKDSAEEKERSMNEMDNMNLINSFTTDENLFRFHNNKNDQYDDLMNNSEMGKLGKQCKLSLGEEEKNNDLDDKDLIRFEERRNVMQLLLGDMNMNEKKILFNRLLGSSVTSDDNCNIESFRSSMESDMNENDFLQFNMNKSPKDFIHSTHANTQRRRTLEHNVEKTNFEISSKNHFLPDDISADSTTNMTIVTSIGMQAQELKNEHLLSFDILTTNNNSNSINLPSSYNNNNNLSSYSSPLPSPTTTTTTTTMMITTMTTTTTTTITPIKKQSSLGVYSNRTNDELEKKYAEIYAQHNNEKNENMQLFNESYEHLYQTDSLRNSLNNNNLDKMNRLSEETRYSLRTNNDMENFREDIVKSKDVNDEEEEGEEDDDDEKEDDIDEFFLTTHHNGNQEHDKQYYQYELGDYYPNQPKETREEEKRKIDFFSISSKTSSPIQSPPAQQPSALESISAVNNSQSQSRNHRSESGCEDSFGRKKKSNNNEINGNTLSSQMLRYERMLEENNIIKLYQRQSENKVTSSHQYYSSNNSSSDRYQQVAGAPSDKIVGKDQSNTNKSQNINNSECRRDNQKEKIRFSSSNETNPFYSSNDSQTFFEDLTQSEDVKKSSFQALGMKRYERISSKDSHRSIDDILPSFPSNRCQNDTMNINGIENNSQEHHKYGEVECIGEEKLLKFHEQDDKDLRKISDLQSLIFRSSSLSNQPNHQEEAREWKIDKNELNSKLISNSIDNASSSNIMLTSSSNNSTTTITTRTTTTTTITTKHNDNVQSNAMDITRLPHPTENLLENKGRKKKEDDDEEDVKLSEIEEQKNRSRFFDEMTTPTQLFTLTHQHHMNHSSNLNFISNISTQLSSSSSPSSIIQTTTNTPNIPILTSTTHHIKNESIQMNNTSDYVITEIDSTQQPSSENKLMGNNENINEINQQSNLINELHYLLSTNIQQFLHEQRSKLQKRKEEMLQADRAELINHLPSFSHASIGSERKKNTEEESTTTTTTRLRSGDDSNIPSTILPTILTRKNNNTKKRPTTASLVQTDDMRYHYNDDVCTSKKCRMMTSEMKSEIDALHHQSNVLGKRLAHNIDSIQNYWSPELRRKRNEIKEETIKTIIVTDKLSELNEEKRVLLLRINEMTKELTRFTAASQHNICNDNQSLDSIIPNKNINEDNQSSKMKVKTKDNKLHHHHHHHHHQQYHEKQQQKLVKNNENLKMNVCEGKSMDELNEEAELLRETINQLEVFIETQRQTLETRDKSIKHLLDLLNKQGIPIELIKLENGCVNEKELEQQSPQIKATIKEKAEEMLHIEKELQSAQKLLEEYRAQSDALKLLQNNMQNVDGYQHLLQNKDAKIQVLESQLSTVQGIVQSCQDRQRQYESQMKQLVDLHSDKENKLTQKLADTQQQLIESHRELQTFQKLNLNNNSNCQSISKLTLHSAFGLEDNELTSLDESSLNMQLIQLRNMEKYWKEKHENVKCCLMKKEREVMALSTKIEALDSKENDLQHYVSVLKEAIHNREQQADIIQGEVNDIRLRVREKDTLIEQKNQNIQAIQIEKFQRETEIVELRDHLEIKDRKIAVMQRKIENLEEQLQDREQELHHVRTRTSLLQEQILQAQKHHNHLKQRIEESTRTAVLLAQHSDHGEEADKWRFEAEKCSEEVRQLQNELHLVIRQREELQHQLRSAINALSTSNNQQQIMASSLEILQQQQQQQQQVQQQQQQQLNKYSSNDDLVKLNNNESQSISSQQQHQQQQQQQSLNDNKQNKLESDIEKNDQLSQSMRSNTNRLHQQKINQFEQEIVRLHRELTAKDTQVKQLQQKLLEKERHINECVSSYDVLRDEREREAHAAQQQIQELQQQIIRLQQENHQQRQQFITGCRDEDNNNNNNNNNDAWYQLQHHHQQHHHQQQQQQQNEEQNKKVQMIDNGTCTSEDDEAERTLITPTTISSSSDSAISRDITDTSSCLSSTSVNYDSLNEQLEQLTHENEKLSNEISLLNNEKENISTRFDMLMSEKQNLQNQLQSMTKERNDFGEENHSLVESLEKAQVKIEQLQEQIEPMSKEEVDPNGNLQRTITERERRIEELEAALCDSFNVTAEREVEQKKEMEKNRKELEKRDKKIESIQRQMKSLQEELEKLKKLSMNDNDGSASDGIVSFSVVRKLQQDMSLHFKQIEKTEKLRVEELNNLMVSLQESLLRDISDKDERIAFLEEKRMKEPHERREIQRLTDDNLNLHEKLKTLQTFRMKIAQDSENVLKNIPTINFDNDEDGIYA
ncbi:hypothetical protein SNEBB_007035 [Seison nebaliae]|nr:hypothetical protein SNEBB_007035 [Seison nebaliae]